MEINLYPQINTLKHPLGVQEIQVTKDLREGRDSLDNQGFQGNQEDKEDQVISSRELHEQSYILLQCSLLN